MGRCPARGAAALALALASIVFTASDANAYTPTISDSGRSVRWPISDGRVQLNFAGNPTNRSGLSPSDFFSAVVHGLQRWQQASDGVIHFDYWQGTDPGVYEPNSNLNQLSSIYFASASGSSNNLSPNVLGLTQVWYDTGNGKILETDVVLNDLNYTFTTDPRDTSGYGTVSGSEVSHSGGGINSRRVYIENVITHELGHAIGLSHSGGLQSTMLFMESPEQAILGCDEQVGVRAIYGLTGGRGSIHGKVLTESGQKPIFGAHVLAISRRRGTVLASALTNRAGEFSVDALEPGSYFLMAEPFFAGSAALPGYYSGIDLDVCDGQSFSRTLLTTAGGDPRAIEVSGGGVADSPAIVARCAHSGAAVSHLVSAERWSSAPAVFSGEKGGFGVTDRFNANTPLYYRLSNVSGHVEITAMAYSLYSPVHAQVELLDQDGNYVSVASTDTVYRGTSGYVNYDTRVVADDLPLGDYQVRVSGTPMSASLYPAGPVSLDSVPFLVLAGSVNESTPTLASSIPVNARCRLEEKFATYTSPPGPPPRSKEDKSGGGFIGFCGRTRDSDGGGSDGSNGPWGGASPGEIAGWFLPWVTMGLFVQILRRRELRDRARTATLYA